MSRRPRLAISVSARRHIVDGEAMIALHGAQTDLVLSIGEREWTVLQCADGTRDIHGIAAAVEREGRSVLKNHLTSFFSELEIAGLIVDGVELTEEERRTESLFGTSSALTEDQLEEHSSALRGRPLDVLFGSSFTCDGSGACCSTFNTVLFSPQEALVARATCPEILEGGDREDLLFTPERGGSLHGPASSRGVRAVTTVDGRCAYLNEDRRCELHHRGGVSSKPLGCRLFPLTFVDDGEAIRVSLSPECSCVFTRPGGRESLIEGEARTFDDLHPSTFVRRLPEHIALTSSILVDRADLAVWSKRIVQALESNSGRSDVVKSLWQLSRAIENRGLSPEWPEGETIPRDALEPMLENLRSTLAQQSAQMQHLGTEHDPKRKTTTWITEACEQLLENGPLPSPSEDEHLDEIHYLQLIIHGYGIVEERSLVDALRERALRMLVARLLPSPHPLALVEPVIRRLAMASAEHNS